MPDLSPKNFSGGPYNPEDTIQYWQDHGLLSNDTEQEVPQDVNSLEEGDTQLFSMSQYLNDNPDATWLDAWTEAAKHSDEWAEKLMDYYAEKQSLDEANAYTANREDTAYQRLVADLQKAGLNPAMMFGSSASPSASGSQGFIRQSEGANSRSVGAYSKLKQLILNVAMYELKKNLGTANTAIRGFTSIFSSILGAIF